MANDANKYGGSDSWDDYDNSNTMKVATAGASQRRPVVKIPEAKPRLQPNGPRDQRWEQTA